MSMVATYTLNIAVGPASLGDFVQIINLSSELIAASSYIAVG